jgi:hypothetical protein
VTERPVNAATCTNAAGALAVIMECRDVYGAETPSGSRRTLVMSSTGGITAHETDVEQAQRVNPNSVHRFAVH